MNKKKDGELFVGTVADFSGMDPLIYREPLRTEQYDATNLNGMRLEPLPLITDANLIRNVSQLQPPTL